MFLLSVALSWAEPSKAKVFTSAFGYETILVEATSFNMGSMSGDVDESTHNVELTRSYYIGQTEMTVEFWKKVMGTAPWTRAQADCMRNGLEEMPEHRSPVYCVDWNDAAYFANVLSDWERLEQCYQFENERLVYAKGTECLGYRLPTEAEWEHAARSGLSKKDKATEKNDTKTEHVYSGGDDIRLLGWYQDNSENLAQLVGLLKPNERGIYDMSGNLWEWCHDWYGSYEQLGSLDPSGSSHGVYRVLRGGSFASPAQDTRISNRFRRYPTFRSHQIGFRLARTVPPKPKKESRDKK